MRFFELRNSIRPADHIEAIRPYLPSRYAPLRENGAGLQAVYLTELSRPLAELLIDLIGSEARSIVQAWQVAEPVLQAPLAGQVAWEEHQLDSVKTDAALLETEKSAIVLARRGQGLFRQRVAAIERRCRVTGVTQSDYLRASHSKPWRDSTNEERLNGENGLLLTPDVDLLFDRGFIGFDDNGDVLVSPVADVHSFEKMGLAASMLKNVGGFSEGQKAFLQFHRDNIFLQARLR